MKQDFLKVYDPKNANSLTEEQAAAIGNLTTDEINQLAKTYPNQNGGMSYLVLRDKSLPDNKQLFPVSSWQNLAELHRLGQTNMVPAGFRSSFNRAEQPSSAKLKTAPAQDLTADEIQNAPGLHKTGQPGGVGGDYAGPQNLGEGSSTPGDTGNVNDNLPNLDGNEGKSSTSGKENAPGQVKEAGPKAAGKGAAKGKGTAPGQNKAPGTKAAGKGASKKAAAKKGGETK